MQLAGGNKDAFAFRVLTVAKDALLKHPDDKVRSLRDLESVMQIRFVAGAPMQGGPSDPDEVGLLPWQLAMYSTSLDATLDFVHFILEYKVQQGYLQSMPELVANVVGSGNVPLPAPWQKLEDASVAMPGPFTALPPRGRRHVLAQLEKKEAKNDGETVKEAENDGETVNVWGDSEEEEEGGGDAAADLGTATYILSFYGGIYHFKDRFELKSIPGAVVPINAADKRDYVRYLEFAMDTTAMEPVTVVLEDMLKQIPVYFINMPGEADPVARWLRQQPSIMEVES